jgi:hypothetical protein
LAGELFFFLLANKKGVRIVSRNAAVANIPSCVLLHDMPQNNLTTFEHSNVEHNLKPSRVLGQLSSANALEEFDDCNLLRNASQVQPPSVPNANGQMFQENGSNSRDRYVINENEDWSSQVHKLMLRSKGSFSLSSLRAIIHRCVLYAAILEERLACKVLQPRSLELSGAGLPKNLRYLRRAKCPRTTATYLWPWSYLNTNPQ